MNVRMEEVREIWRKLPRKDWASVRQAFEERGSRRGEDASEVLDEIGRFERAARRFPDSPEQLERMLQGPLSESARARHEREREQRRGAESGQRERLSAADRGGGQEPSRNPAPAATATAAKTTLSRATARAVIRVADYGRAKRFYSQALGLSVRDMADTTTREGYAEAGNGTGFGFYERPMMPAAQNTVMSFDVADVDSAVEELRARGVTFEEYDLPEQGLRTENGIATMRGEKVAWFKDTEGNIFSVGCTCR